MLTTIPLIWVLTQMNAPVWTHVMAWGVLILKTTGLIVKAIEEGYWR